MLKLNFYNQLKPGAACKIGELTMRMTKEQLLIAARTAAKYLPAASADIMTELANRLDVTSVALSEALEQQ
jgi:hypothetical protein